MEERCSVNSPRRILSFSKNREANVSFADVDHRSPAVGPKLSEVYGFVGSITTVVFTDEFSREAVSGAPSTDDDEQPIEPISDIGINKINEIMFNSLK